MIIVDAGALVGVLIRDDDTGKRVRQELARDTHWAAPPHLVAEVFSVIRGLWLGKKITDDRAEEAISTLPTMSVEVVGYPRLLHRMWELRGNLSAYDAAYVAAAEAHRAPLITTDARIPRAPGLTCEIRLVPVTST